MILRRLENSRFSEIVPEWVGQTVVLLGAGPSLTTEQIEDVAEAHARERIKCIAVNDCYLVAPWAEVNYFADSHWWKWHVTGIEKPMLGLSAEQVRQQFASFAGQKCSIQNSGANIEDEAVHMLRNSDFPNHGVGLSSDPQCLVTGRNSGFQALNMAVLAGSTRIILLGFDGKPSAEGLAHFFGEHPRPTPVAAYQYYRQAMSAAEKALKDLDVEVFNCSPGSAIDTFPKVKLLDVL